MSIFEFELALLELFEALNSKINCFFFCSKSFLLFKCNCCCCCCCCCLLDVFVDDKEALELELL